MMKEKTSMIMININIIVQHVFNKNNTEILEETNKENNLSNLLKLL